MEKEHQYAILGPAGQIDLIHGGIQIIPLRDALRMERLRGRPNKKSAKKPLVLDEAWRLLRCEEAKYKETNDQPNLIISIAERVRCHGSQ